MAMKLVREGKKTEYKQENGQIITVVQPEVYQRIYCKNCNNEVDSEEEATGTQNWTTDSLGVGFQSRQKYSQGFSQKTSQLQDYQNQTWKQAGWY